jgi:hypothetical protein
MIHFISATMQYFIRIKVNGYDVSGNRVADDTAATIQDLDWSDRGISSVTEGSLQCTTT